MCHPRESVDPMGQVVFWCLWMLVFTSMTSKLTCVRKSQCAINTNLNSNLYWYYLQIADCRLQIADCWFVITYCFPLKEWGETPQQCRYRDVRRLGGISRVYSVKPPAPSQGTELCLLLNLYADLSIHPRAIILTNLVRVTYLGGQVLAKILTGSPKQPTSTQLTECFFATHTILATK